MSNISLKKLSREYGLCKNIRIKDAMPKKHEPNKRCHAKEA
jgi:hypothetical protein